MNMSRVYFDWNLLISEHILYIGSTWMVHIFVQCMCSFLQWRNTCERDEACDWQCAKYTACVFVFVCLSVCLGVRVKERHVWMRKRRRVRSRSDSTHRAQLRAAPNQSQPVPTHPYPLSHKSHVIHRKVAKKWKLVMMTYYQCKTPGI